MIFGAAATLMRPIGIFMKVARHFWNTWSNMIYIEYGLDFDNNRFGLGRSVEVERDDGTEYRTKEKIKLSQKNYYFRLWFY